MNTHLARKLRRSRTGAMVLLCGGLFGCATSDDPREGGLIGYWQQGEKGYQERLERRKVDLEQEEAHARNTRDRQTGLEERITEQRATLARHQEELAALREQVSAIKASVTLLAERDQSDRELDRIERQLNDAQSELTTLESDTDLAIRERTRRITTLKKELRLLRERTSLLISL